jgi:hypothetical protein
MPRVRKSRIAAALAFPALLLFLGHGVSGAERPTLGPITGALLAEHESERFMRDLIGRERNFFRPGVAWDAETGMTHDGHLVDYATGALRPGLRNWSAASKEMLHISLLVRAVAGDPDAQELLTPDPRQPDRAVELALDVLERKIGSYERFHRDYPGYGGFLPWYRVRRVQGGAGEHSIIEPTSNWGHRVPGLDNGQSWAAIYFAANKLRELGHSALADRYQRHFDLMRQNVVRVFFDRAHKQFRAEARLVEGNRVPVELNRYETNNNVHEGLVGKALRKLGWGKVYLLDDAYEGLMLVHLADLFGDWRGIPQQDRDAVWARPRRRPATYRFNDEAGRRRRITVSQGYWFSSHEEWGNLALPFRDEPVADQLFVHAQKVRAAHAWLHDEGAFRASTHNTYRQNVSDLDYRSGEGIAQVASQKVRSDKVLLAPYANYVLAMVDRRLFTTWMKHTVAQEGAAGETGLHDSFSPDGSHAPVGTWDGKALPLLAYMGGITDDVRRYMQRDGVYGQFRARVALDHRLFAGRVLHGEDVPFYTPTSPKSPRAKLLGRRLQPFLQSVRRAVERLGRPLIRR